MLADGHSIEIAAGFEPAASGSAGPLSDVCAVAETATASAATTLADTGIGHGEPPATGLWTTDACTLLTPQDLSFLPGQDRTDGYRNFAGWQCEWGDGKDPETGVLVSFGRYSPPQETGRPAPGTPAFVGDNTQPGQCRAEVPKRPFVGTGGRGQAEVLRVRAEGPLSEQELCDRAAALAAAANART